LPSRQYRYDSLTCPSGPPRCRYDHYYGTLNGVRGFNDRAQTSLPSGLPSLFQPSNQAQPATDYILPFPAWTTNTSSICMGAPTMEYVDHAHHSNDDSATRP
jgi:phospholipase C